MKCTVRRSMKNRQIIVNQRFKTSTKIDAHVADSTDFIDEFIVHDTVLSTLETLSLQINNSSQRAYTLTGPYGSGKSTLALFLSYLLSCTVAERDLASKKLSKINKKIIPRFNI